MSATFSFDEVTMQISAGPDVQGCLQFTLTLKPVAVCHAFQGTVKVGPVCWNSAAKIVICCTA